MGLRKEQHLGNSCMFVLFRKQRHGSTQRAASRRKRALPPHRECSPLIDTDCLITQIVHGEASLRRKAACTKTHPCYGAGAASMMLPEEDFTFVYRLVLDHERCSIP
jgi:hypothetical protein